jgi:uncharacterized protein YgfB (UPF0149 family)
MVNLGAPKKSPCYYFPLARVFDQIYSGYFMQVDYESMGQYLADAGVDVGASGAHGLLCGLVCAGERDIQQQLSGEWFSTRDANDPAVHDCQQSIDKLVQEVYSSVEGVDFGFPLLLPDDSDQLKLRATAVRDWCDGFLYGVGLVKQQGKDGLSSQAQEALNDISEISRMDVDAVEGGEEEEAALTEVIEFIWVAAMLVHDELVTPEPGRDGP